ncbi:MAG: hypothetical protein DWQ02_18660, partial [Bacteroidetes bacterium]
MGKQRENLKDWEARNQAKFVDLADYIDEDNCVLVLGPEIPFAHKEGLDIHQALLEHLDQKEIPLNSFYANDGFFAFPDNSNARAAKEIRKFYRGLQPSLLYEMISAIP